MRTPVVVLFVICVALLAPLAASAEEPDGQTEAQETTGLRCEQMVFCAGVKGRTPVGTSDTFPSDIFSVYCFTAIAGAEDTTAIMHNWYHGDEKIATVELSVKSEYWRTWSSKRMIPGWSGVWRVDVATADGAVIESGHFTLE